MPNLPDNAVQAAAEVLFRDYESQYSADHLTWRDFAGLAREALGAAAPAMAEHAAQAILAHRDAHGPADGASRRRWRRYLGVASQVVSFAFSTEEDKKRLAAQAIADGNYVACPEITGG